LQIISIRHGANLWDRDAQMIGKEQIDAKGFPAFRSWPRSTRPKHHDGNLFARCTGKIFWRHGPVFDKDVTAVSATCANFLRQELSEITTDFCDANTLKFG
jgi:hypothetical protein